MARRIGDFSNLKGADPKEILAAIPPDAKQLPWTQIEGGAKDGSKYAWIDKDGARWKLRMHGPDPGAPEGSNSSKGWIVRIQRDKQYMDSSGSFHRKNLLNRRSLRYNKAVANDTHIPIQTPGTAGDYRR